MIPPISLEIKCRNYILKVSHLAILNTIRRNLE